MSNDPLAFNKTYQDNNNKYWMRRVSIPDIQYRGLRLYDVPKGKRPVMDDLRAERLEHLVVRTPWVSKPDPMFAVDYVVHPWLLFWFAGPELQATSGKFHDEEEKAIKAFKIAIAVSPELMDMSLVSVATRLIV